MLTPREIRHLPTKHIGRKIWCYDCVASTNTLAAELAADRANDGLAIVAAAQSAGRGQHGRSWITTPGDAVLLSVILFPPREFQRPVVLAAWAATAVCQTIAECTQLPPTIKWPNDVLVRGKKVCGILIEQARATVVGIGLNVNQTEETFTQVDLPDAASLASLTGRQWEVGEVCQVLLRRLDDLYAHCIGGAFAVVESQWIGFSDLVGESVEVECHSCSVAGRLTTLSLRGVEVEHNGRREMLVPESIRHIHRLNI